MTKNIYSIGLAIFILLVIIYVIFSQINEHYLQDDPMIDYLKKLITPLFDTSKSKHFSGILEELNHKNIMDYVTLYRGKKSYTINKHKIFLCLKDENNEYYNYNNLLYVLLHEYSHALCDEIGHTEKFHDIFQALLDKATEFGIYNPSIPMINNYCMHN